LKQIYDIIIELRADNSTNYKLEVLAKYKNNKLLRKFLLYTYTPRFNYFITDLPESELFRHSANNLDETSFFSILDQMKSREITGNTAREKLSEHLSHYNSMIYELYELVIKRDIRAGVSTKSINKVFPNLIPTTPYMRCSLLKDYKETNLFGKHNTIFVQKKADGVFSYIIKEDNQIKFQTRNGTIYYVEDIEKDFDFIPNNTVLVGEALIISNGKELDRKTGNGLINKLIKSECSFETLEKDYAKATTQKQKDNIQIKQLQLKQQLKDIVEGLHFEVWDMISVGEFDNGYSGEVYSSRLSRLERLLQNISNRVSLIETSEVVSLELAEDIAEQYISQGYEGAIIKSKDLLFENKTSKSQIKIKSEFDCDLLCIGVTEGNGKYKGLVGALECVSACGNLKVSVGSGLTDEMRSADFKEYIGKIITVKYNEKITKKDSDEISLFLPRFVEVRVDKDTADTLDRIL
jgi:DNA ligase-1